MHCFKVCQDRLLCGLLLAGMGITDGRAEVIEEIVVTAHPLSGEGLAQATHVLEGDSLQRNLAINIGATLAKQPGIHSAQFGQAVGRPIIHGLGGARVRTMEDRIDTLDVSVTSGDHAVAVEPFVAERIEVLKGPSTLLYGSGAIGGVVDVHTARIPHIPAEVPLSGAVESRYNSNNHGTSSAAKLNGGAGAFAWHLDGAWKDGEDYDIPGFVASRGLRAAGSASARGTLPGSRFDSDAFAAGVGYVGDGRFAGVAISRIEASYGLPGLETLAEHGTPSLALEQTRMDVEVGIEKPFASIVSLNLRLGVNDYEHQEIEPDGAVGTDFSNEAWEARAELVYERGPWRGVAGVQYADKAFAAIGEEAFLDPVDSRDAGLFWLLERPLGAIEIEGGVRVGRVEHRPVTNRGRSRERSRSFHPYAISVGLNAPLTARWQLGLVADFATRAPVAEELYSNGPHIVTGTFEIGESGLDMERALNLAATAQFDGAQWTGSISAYAMRFADFIYQQASGAVEDGLAVFRYQQHNARFVGVDAQLDGALWSGVAAGQPFELRGRLLLDWVRARLQTTGEGALPKIPPLRMGAGLDAQWRQLSAAVDFVWVAKQSEVAPFELPSERYTDLSLHIGYSIPFASERELRLFVQGKNITDEEQRLHTSPIKDFAPAAGRTWELGLQLTF